jgi:hypothetical protein
VLHLADPAALLRFFRLGADDALPPVGHTSACVVQTAASICYYASTTQHAGGTQARLRRPKYRRPKDSRPNDRRPKSGSDGSGCSGGAHLRHLHRLVTDLLTDMRAAAERVDLEPRAAESAPCRRLCFIWRIANEKERPARK